MPNQWLAKTSSSHLGALVTPGARVAAAIEVLDQILTGAPAEKALTTWARQHRFAGSKDRAAIRDHVFGALRCRRSFAARGGAQTGRGLMIGAFHDDPDARAALFSGEGYAPAPIAPGEVDAIPDELPLAVALDCPDWLMPRLQASLGADFAPVMTMLQKRASVFLRVNQARISRDDAQAALAAEGIAAQPHPLSKNALEVTENARKIKQSKTYLDGLVELQDAASQAVVDLLPAPGGRVLDFCAGGGGKALAMAARTRGAVFAHDAAPGRMADLPARAARAGAEVSLLRPEELGKAAPFDLVYCDVPCSGSGAWRRSPEGKWLLSEARLSELCATQAEILRRASALVAPGGALAYMTCSLLDDENITQIDRFVRECSGWEVVFSRRLTPMDGGDGFFVSLLRRGS